MPVGGPSTNESDDEDRGRQDAGCRRPVWESNPAVRLFSTLDGFAVRGGTRSPSPADLCGRALTGDDRPGSLADYRDRRVPLEDPRQVRLPAQLAGRSEHLATFSPLPRGTITPPDHAEERAQHDEHHSHHERDAEVEALAQKVIPIGPDRGLASLSCVSRAGEDHPSRRGQQGAGPGSPEQEHRLDLIGSTVGNLSSRGRRATPLEPRAPRGRRASPCGRRGAAAGVGRARGRDPRACRRLGGWIAVGTRSSTCASGRRDSARHRITSGIEFVRCVRASPRVVSPCATRSMPGSAFRKRRFATSASIPRAKSTSPLAGITPRS